MSKIRRFGPVWFVPGENNGKYPHCHSIYIEGPGVLIDPASDREALIGLKNGPGVKEVWLTHWHEDHLAYLDLFGDVPFRMSRRDAPPLGDLETFLDWYEMDEPESRDLWRDIMIKQFNYRPRTPNGFLTPGTTMDLDAVSVEVLHTPGHTPGHLSFLFKEPGVLFMGDYDLTPFGPYYGELYADIQQVVDSVKLLQRVPAKVWLTSHETGVFTENPGALWQEYLDVIQEREGGLLDFLAEPRSKQEIINAWIAYKKPRQPLDFYTFSEWSLMKRHLDRLVRLGTVKQHKGRFELS